MSVLGRRPRRARKERLPHMDAAVAGVVGAAIGAAAATVGAVLARTTERQGAARETMISQSDRVSQSLRTCIYASECLLADDVKLRRSSSDGAPEAVEALDLARATHLEAAAWVASTHSLFHRQVYSWAERALDDLANALAHAATLPNGAADLQRSIDEARVNVAKFAECAGADIRWPAGFARRFLRWDEHAQHAADAEAARRERA